jgi:5'-nucleotidase/UDP-sugar diphosphatase
MKKFIIFIGIVGILGLFSFAQAQVDTLTILHLNDTHSHLLPYGPKNCQGNWMWGGMARLATLVGMNKISLNKVLLLHAGDFFVGDFMFQKYLGVAELEIMKGLGYDALELGNHEFDLYPSTLEYVLNQAGFPNAGFPVLCANLDISGEPALGNFVKPYIIKNLGGLKVGIFGLLTDFTNQNSNPSPVVVLPPLPQAQIWVDSLKSHNCDLIILVSHLGADIDQLVAASVSGINAIVGGHTHTTIPTPITIGNTLIVQAGEFGRYLGKLTLFLNNKNITNWTYELQSVDSSIPEEPTLAGMISNLALGVEADPRFGPVYTQKIAFAKNNIEKPLGEGLFKDNGLGNLISDAMRDKTATDIALQPQGFSSQTIYKGAVRGADIFQAVPYGFDQTSGLGFKLATFQTTGMSIIAGLEFSVYYLPFMEDFFLHCSNFSYVYNSSNSPGSRVDYSTIKVGGQPLNPLSDYTVTVPEGVVPFLTQIPGFQVNNLSITNNFVYTTVKDFIVSHSPVAYYTEGRVIDLALLSDPVKGVLALKEVVNLYLKNGSIDNWGIANSLKSKLNQVYKHLQEGENNKALKNLKAFKLEVRALPDKHISGAAAEKLLYLADKLRDSIIGSPLFAGTSDSDSDEETETQLPQEFKLFQNYPNPFNPSTEIAYTLPRDSYVKLFVYDILGQKVKTLVDEVQSAGPGKVIWDGANENGEKVASGIYFYKLSTAEFSQTKKMLLLK